MSVVYKSGQVTNIYWVYLGLLIDVESVLSQAILVNFGMEEKLDGAPVVLNIFVYFSLVVCDIVPFLYEFPSKKPRYLTVKPWGSNIQKIIVFFQWPLVLTFD